VGFSLSKFREYCGDVARGQSFAEMDSSRFELRLRVDCEAGLLDSERSLEAVCSERFVGCSERFDVFLRSIDRLRVFLPVLPHKER